MNEDQRKERKTAETSFRQLVRWMLKHGWTAERLRRLLKEVAG